MILLLCYAPAIGQSFNTQVEAAIYLESNSEFLKVTGLAYNKTNFSQSLKYEMVLFRTDSLGANRSRNSQNGRLVLQRGQKKSLSNTIISAEDTDRIIILLLVYNEDDVLIGKDRIVVNGNQNDRLAAQKAAELKAKMVSKDATQPGGDGVLLRGLVTEDTKTRPGRDFYRMFDTKYRDAKINGEKVITIKESLSLANTTKIEVFVGNSVVFNFILRPQNDFLEMASDQAVDRVGSYFKALRESNIIERF